MERPRGFTLVEMLLYITLFAITTGVLASVYANNLVADRLAKRAQDLNQARELVSLRIRELAFGANEITSPSSGSSDTLTFAGPGVEDGPATLSVLGGTLYLDTASTDPAAISPPNITVSAFAATRASGSPPGVGVTMTLTAAAGSREIDDTFTVFATLRYE